MEKFLCEKLPGKPIWVCGGGNDNEYADFFPDVALKAGKKYVLRIAADTDYNVFLGGRLEGFGQYSSYPSDLVYDDIPLEPVACGEKLVITAWHSGVDSLCHIRHKAYVVFCIFEEDRCIYSSSEKTLSRLSCMYVQHGTRKITGQLGLSFDLDGVSSPVRAVPSVHTDIGNVSVRARPNLRLALEPPSAGRCVMSGTYRLRGGTDAAELMTNALKDVPPGEEDGRYYVYDLGRESVGFPDIEFSSSSGGTALVGWGEHLYDGMCRTVIGDRRFAFSCLFRTGRNRFFPSFRRLGCRYIQVFIPGSRSEVSVRFVQTVYPVSEKSNPFQGLRADIYKTAVHTLRCCMHEHYEDCPWREQSLYTLDSRNQILAGSEVFEGGNLKFARASLDLVSRGVRQDGLLTLCAPGGIDNPIPFYTLAYFIEVDEYVRASGDAGFAIEKLSLLEGLMNAVLKRMTASGEYRNLVPRWPAGMGNYWNFYEWAPGLDGSQWSEDPDVLEIRKMEVYDAPFNASLVLALESYAGILNAAGLKDSASVQKKLAEKIKKAIARVFANEEGLCASFRGPVYDKYVASDRRISALTQALCVLAGIPASEKMLEIIAQNGGNGAVPATLSMACFRYDALLKTDSRRFAPVILDEIDRDCSFMLNRGATTFWETLYGEGDFDGAGSLCHGWSAMAAYYYRKLLCG